MWYVVQTMAGREFAVQRQIEQFASDDVLDECFVPQYEVQKHLRGEWRTCTAVLFPGYLIVVSDRIAELQAQLKQIPQFASVLNNDGYSFPRGWPKRTRGIVFAHQDMSERFAPLARRLQFPAGRPASWE